MLALQTNDLGSNLARYGFVSECTWFITAEGLPSSSLCQKNMLTGAQKSKDVMRMPVENKTKPLITATRQSIRNHGSLNYAFFSTVCAIIGRFTFLVRGWWPLDPSNAWHFVGGQGFQLWFHQIAAKWLPSKQLYITLNASFPGLDRIRQRQK